MPATEDGLILRLHYNNRIMYLLLDFLTQNLLSKLPHSMGINYKNGTLLFLISLRFWLKFWSPTGTVPEMAKNSLSSSSYGICNSRMAYISLLEGNNEIVPNSVFILLDSPCRASADFLTGYDTWEG